MSTSNGQIDPILQQKLNDMQRLIDTLARGVLTLTRHPFANEIPDRGFQGAIVSGTPRIYFRNGANRYYVDMTAV